jgi:hypothetical protein
MGLPRVGEGCGGIPSLREGNHHISLRGPEVVRVDQTGVTEPPRLTSDSICTADRRGGILISCGRKRTAFGAIKAPIRIVAGRSRRVRVGAESNRAPVAVCRSHSTGTDSNT